MATIKEDFVSFETAKLLKEKNCPDFGYSCICDSEGNKAQTQSIIMKWLREVHNIYLNIDVRVILGQWSGYDISIHTIDNDGFLNKKIPVVLNDNTSYEQACEAAIKYCLENLI